MPEALTAALLWFSALGCGMLAGLYFAFSAFIMRSLGRVEASAGIAAMNAINVDIQRSLFMVLFLGSTLSAAVLAGTALLNLYSLDPDEAQDVPMLIGGVVYVAGMFVVTMIWNV